MYAFTASIVKNGKCVLVSLNAWPFFIIDQLCVYDGYVWQTRSKVARHHVFFVHIHMILCNLWTLDVWLQIMDDESVPVHLTCKHIDESIRVRPIRTYTIIMVFCMVILILSGGTCFIFWLSSDECPSKSAVCAGLGIGAFVLLLCVACMTVCWLACRIDGYAACTYCRACIRSCPSCSCKFCCCCICTLTPSTND